MDDVKQFGKEAEYDDAPAITLGDLRDGESVTLTFNALPGMIDTDHGAAIRAESEFVGSEDYTWTPDDHDGEVEEGDEVVLISWSKRLAQALTDANDDEGLVDGTFEITKHGAGFDTDYTVESTD